MRPLPAIWLVRDGVVTTGTFDGLTEAPTGVVDLRWTPAGFVMALVQNVGGRGEASVWVSSDGTGWTRTLDVTKGTITGLGTIGDQTIAFGTDTTWQTADGITWDETPTQGIQALRHLDRHRARGRQAPGWRHAVYRPQHLQGSDIPGAGGPAGDRLDR